MTSSRRLVHCAGSVLRLAGAGCLAVLLSLSPALPQQPGNGGATAPAPGSSGSPTRAITVPPPAWQMPPIFTAPRPSRTVVPAASETRFVPDEIVFELAPDAQAETVLRRYGATLITSRRVELAGTTLIRARLEAGRDLRTVLTQMADDAAIAGAQPNFTYELQQELARPVSTTASGSGRSEVPTLRLSDPAAIRPAAPRRELPPQYVIDKLRLGDVHKLARGAAIRVAVIDSGVDVGHPELRGAIAGHFDALGEAFVPHAHGTAMAAAIAAQGQLQGVAPAAQLLVARAFSGRADSTAASGTSLQIMAAIEWAVNQGARVINLSFAGPEDRLLSRGLAGVAARGIVTVAAAGNGGPGAAPFYPGADPNVIAVTATDADDRIFRQANRGGYIALAAPGVDVLAAEPQGRYAFSSGTSIAAAHVSGLVALVLEKRPDLDPAGMRRLLSDSAVDLGARGRDVVYGAGRIDAAAALAHAQPVTASRP